MDRDALIARIAALPGVDALRAQDAAYFYHDPERTLDRQKEHPFATITWADWLDVTPVSDLARRGLWRLNLGVGREAYRARFGPEPPWGEGGGPVATGHDFARVDAWLPHPIYAPMSWICIVAPAAAREAEVHARVADAHALAREAFARRRPD